MALRQPDGATWLVLGVMTAPAAKQNRRNLRELSHSEPGVAPAPGLSFSRARAPHALELPVRGLPKRNARAVFVLGDCECARNGTVREAENHRDIVYVKSDDCRTWHRPAKVFAWFQFAVSRWPRASWYAKSEDDGVVRLSSLMRDLGGLDAREPWYYGIMQLTASCSFRDTCPDAPASTAGSIGSAGSADWGGCCGGCFLGALSPYPSLRNGCLGKLRAGGNGRGSGGGKGKGEGAKTARSCEMPRCRPAGPEIRGEINGGRLRTPHSSCADAPTAPFAVGPIEVRSRPLALESAGCAHAQRYMAALSRRGELLGQDCASMDGAQAFTLTMCSKRVRLADATWRRMSYVPSAIRNARGQNETRLVWAHPAKSLAPTQARAARAVWRALAERPYLPAPLHTYELSTEASQSGGGEIRLRATETITTVNPT